LREAKTTQELVDLNARRQKGPTFERRRSRRSTPAPASEKPPLWWHRRGATGRRGLGQKSGLLVSLATGRGLFMAAKWLMFYSFFFWFFWLVDQI